MRFSFIYIYIYIYIYISEHKQNTHNDGNRVSEFDEKKTVIHGYVLKHSNHDDPKKSLKLTF